MTLACHSNRRSLARPIVTSADTDYNEHDHPESVMTTPDSNIARVLVNEMRRSSTLTNEENDSHKPSISSNLLADLFRRRETAVGGGGGGGGSNPLKIGTDKKREDTAEDNTSKNVDKGKRIVWGDNDSSNNGSAEIDIVVDSGIYDDDQNREDNNYVQSNKQKKQGQLNESRTDSSIVTIHFTTKQNLCILNGRHRAKYVIEKGSDKVGSLVWVVERQCK